MPIARRAHAPMLLALCLGAAACGGRRETGTSPAPAPADATSAAAAAAAGVVPPRYSEVVGGSGKNLAFDAPADTVDPRLTEHSRKMAQRIYRTAGNVYCAVGYGLANTTMIEGDDGVVMIDALESEDAARAAMADLRKISTKPVKALIYTHNHYDHVMGADAVVDRTDVDAGRVPVIAQAKLVQGLLNQLSVVGEAIGLRSSYTFGSFLDEAADGAVNEGIGPKLVSGPTGFIAPTRTFDDRLELTIAGVHMVLLHAPSEADDEIVVWLPEKKLLQSAEVIQGETYPNLYSIRGTTYRDPVKWYESIDSLRALEPAYLVPSHGRPVEGAAEVASLLTSYRDAIQYTHDQAVRLINKGYTPDEIAAALPGLPPHLAAHPWLQEIYGTVKHSVRNVYGGYLGWFQGDPTTLDPAPPHERAERYVRQMGGRDAILKAARAAVDGGDDQWAAELLGWVIRLDPKDADARTLKAQALRRLGLRQLNINWRNFYLTAARELDGTLDAGRYDTSRGIAIMSRLPLESLLRTIVTRVDAEATRDLHRTLALHTTDTQRDFALEIRRGVVELHRSRPAHVDLVLTATEDVLRGILLRQRSFAKDLVMRDVAVDGSLSELSEFFGFFEPPSKTPAPLAAR